MNIRPGLFRFILLIILCNSVSAAKASPIKTVSQSCVLLKFAIKTCSLLSSLNDLFKLVYTTPTISLKGVAAGKLLTALDEPVTSSAATLTLQTPENSSDEEDGNPDGGNPDGSNSDDGNSDDGNSDDGNSDDGNSDNGNSDNGNSDNGNSDNGNPDNGNPDNGNPDDDNSDDDNSDDDNLDDDISYFLKPDEQQGLLTEFLSELQKINREIRLSVDIDGTILHNSEHLDFLQNQQAQSIFDHQQLSSLQRLKTWFTALDDSVKLTLIYNTARDFSDYSTLEDIPISPLPTPHLLISNGGTSIHIAKSLPDHLKPLSERRSEIMEKAKILVETTSNHEDLINIHIKNTPGSADIIQKAHQEKKTIKTATYIDSLFPDIESYSEAHAIYTQISWLEGAYKQIFTYEKMLAFYLIDLTVNKGSALIFLSQFLPSYPSENDAWLFTAGDTITDLPMLRLDQLGRILSPGGGTNEQIFKDLAPLKLKPSDISKVQKSWQRGFLPKEYEDDSLPMAMEQLGINGELQNRQCTYWGLEGIIDMVKEELKIHNLYFNH